MIANSIRCQITREQAEKFRRALEEFNDRPEAHPGIHPKLIKAQRNAIASQLESLEQEIKSYEPDENRVDIPA